MRIEQNTEGKWVVINDEKTLSVAGQKYFESFEAVSKQVEARGLHVWSNGNLSKTPEPLPEVAEDPVEALSAAQDAEAKKKARIKSASEKRKERYNNDPEYREKILQYQRDRRRNKKDSA